MSLERFLTVPKQTESQLGYQAGRARQPLPDNCSKEFAEGWVLGDSAADTHENEYQVWGRNDD